MSNSKLDGPFGLRKFIERVDSIGELKCVSGAHWDLEMSYIWSTINTWITRKTRTFNPINKTCLIST